MAALAEAERPQSEPARTGGNGENTRPFVSLAQRAAPLLDLLEWALKKRKPVLWGV